MKRFLFLCAAPLAAASLAQAQLDPIWVKYHNSANSEDYGMASAIDGAGNLYFTGSATNATGVGAIFLSKVTPSGTKLWTRTYTGGGGGPDYGWLVEVDPAGNVLVAGESVGIGTGYDLTTLKYDPAGNLLWAQRYDGPGHGEDGVFAGRSLGVDSLGNVVVGGYSYGAGTDYDWLVVKYSPGGTLLWEERINGPANSSDACWGLALDGAGNIYAGGDVYDVSRDILIVKYDPNGSVLWKDQYDGPGGGGTTGGQDWFYQVDVDSSGNVALAGTSDGIGTREDYVTIAYDADGAQLFAEHYDGPASLTEFAFSVAISDAGFVATTGYSNNGSDADAATVLYDLQGNLLWAHRYQHELYYWGHHEGDFVRFDENGDLLALGSGWSGPEEGANTTLLKYAVSGVVLEEVIYDSPVHGDNYGAWLTLDGSGNAYVAGYSQRGARHLDAMLLKLGPGASMTSGHGGPLQEEEAELVPPGIAPATKAAPREIPYRPGIAHRLPSGLRMARE